MRGEIRKFNAGSHRPNAASRTWAKLNPRLTDTVNELTDRLPQANLLGGRAPQSCQHCALVNNLHCYSRSTVVELGEQSPIRSSSQLSLGCLGKVGPVFGGFDASSQSFTDSRPFDYSYLLPLSVVC